MNTKGLWTVEFQTSKAWTNGGVVVLYDEKVLGGDSQYFYAGTFREQGDNITAEITATHYHGPVSTQFGTRERSYQLYMAGKRNGGTVNGHTWRLAAPSQKMALRMIKR